MQSLEGSYEGSRLLRSPRSLRACQMCGIDPHELLVSSKKTVSTAGIPTIIAKERFEHHERQRRQLIALAKVMYHKVLEDEQLAMSTAQPTSSRSPTPVPEKKHPYQAAPSKRDQSNISPVMDSTSASSAVGAHSSPRSVAASNRTMQRVDEVRYRWQAAEENRRQKFIETSRRKQAKIDEICRVKREDAEIELIDRRTIDELRSQDLIERAKAIEAADISATKRKMQEKEAKAAVAIARVQRQQEAIAQRQREAIECTMSHARDMQEMVENIRVQTSRARELDRHQKREQCATNQRSLAVDRTHKNIERVSHVAVLRRQQEEALRSATERRLQKEVMREQHRDALMLEKQLLAEVKREESEDKFAWVLRTQKALRFLRAEKL